MKPLIFFFFLLLVSSSYAYDCARFSGLDQENCVALNNVSEDLIAGIIYRNTSFPDHNFIAQYNNQIQVTSPPNDVALNSSGIIQNAWISLLTVMPSIFYNNTLYIPSIINARAEYGYLIVLPQNYINNNQVNGQTCKIIYSENSEHSSLQWFLDDTNYASGKTVQITGGNYSIITAQATIQATLKADTYVWREYCVSWDNGYCTQYDYECEIKSTTNTPYNLMIQDNVAVTHYNNSFNPTFTIIDEYSNTTKGILSKDNSSNIILHFNNSFYEYQPFSYTANFSKKPYYFLTITANRIDLENSRNLIRSNNVFYVNDANNCSLESKDFFTTTNVSCNMNLTNQTMPIVTPTLFTTNMFLLFKTLVLVFILFLIYKGIKHYWGKTLIPIGVVLFMIPSVRAEDCGLTNLASCIPQKIFEFLMGLLNAPLEPLLNWVQSLLSASPSIDLFIGIWAIIVYCLSLFYAFLFMYAGFQFLISGHDVIKREMAKEWLKNTVIMIVLIQASFYLYGLIVNISATMTSSLLSLIDQHFFMITADNISNTALEFIFVLVYILILLMTVVFLIIRYLIVAFGVLFAPIAIFCYFIPPLRSYGKLMLNILGMLIFITFLDAIIILACSMLITIPLFQNIKILVMVACFSIINLLFLLLGWHIITKTGFDGSAETIAHAAKYVFALA